MSASRKRGGTPSRHGGKRLKEKECVEVVCRLCPFNGDDSCVIALDDQHVKLVAPSGAVSRNGHPVESIYKFAYVFDETDGQDTIFERTAMDLIENVVKGKNSLLFTYGVTGSGKTYTMTGNTSEETIGILPRTFDVIFNSLINRADRCVFKPDGRNGFFVQNELQAAISRRRFELEHSTSSLDFVHRYIERKRVSGVNPDMCFAVFVSYIEVYNDVCYDLLEEPAIKGDGTKMMLPKDLRLGANANIYVENITEIEVDSSTEALEQFYRGQERRRFGDTLLNKQSSRSHSIFNIRIVMAPCQGDSCHPDSNPNTIYVSQLSLVDLAGSERTKRTGNEGVRLVESGKINQSLLVLRQCFEKLRENQLRGSPTLPVPYRESKITHIFKNFFEGSGKVRMIVCVNPNPTDYNENLGVMSFAELSQDVTVAKGFEIAPLVVSDFPVARRDYMKWLSGVESIQPQSVEHITEPPPVFELLGSDDAESIENLRIYYQNAARKRNAISEMSEQKATNLEQKLKSVLCMNDLQELRIIELESERDEAEKLITSLSSQLKQARRENLALRQRVDRYEADENHKADHEEELRRREKLYQEQLRRREKTLHQVREIFDGPVITNHNKNLGVCKSSEGLNSGSTPGDSLVPTMIRNVDGITTSRVASTRQKWEARNIANQNQGVHRTGYYNPRFHRRSKSANCRIVDHQPRNRIPEGTILQPKLPKYTKAVAKINADELKKSSNYMLTHQELDDEGNLTTQILKGECIPTAGGGTAVRFNDVERLSHEIPARHVK